jgi:hypothetical protein
MKQKMSTSEHGICKTRQVHGELLHDEQVTEDPFTYANMLLDQVPRCDNVMIDGQRGRSLLS